MRAGMDLEPVPRKLQDYTWRSCTTPNTHNPCGIQKDILHILDSVGYLDNQQGDV